MRSLALSAVILASAGSALAQPLGTSFTYQGRLTDGGNPASGTYDLQFILFDAASGGTQVGSTVIRDDVTVTNGLFAVPLDFGAVFGGSRRWLEIGVRPGASTGSFTPLGGRQELTPSPNAAFSLTAPWAGIAGKPAGFADDVDNDSGGDITSVAAGSGLSGGGATGAVTVSVDPVATQLRVTGSCAAGSSVRVVNQDGTVVCEADDNSGGTVTSVTGGTGLTGGTITGSGTLAVNTSVIQARISTTCAAGSAIRAVDATGAVTCEADDDTPGWGFTGNSGTNPATNFIGTTDAQPLELRVAGQRALRLEPVSGGTPGLIGGFSGNGATASVSGAVIGGGGQTALPNLVTDDFGTVGGGISNRAGNGSGTIFDASHATVGGGNNNAARGAQSTVGGGTENVASGEGSSVAGGVSNLASGPYATVAGGIGNQATTDYAAVLGGSQNHATGVGSIALGGQTNRAGGHHSLAAGSFAWVRSPAQSGDADGDEGSFVWADTAGPVFQSTGADQFLVRAEGGVGINKNAPVPGTLDVNGPVRMTGFFLPGSAAAGRVLTSDASGNGTWQTPAAGAGDITGVIAGSGLSGGGLSGDVTLSVNTAVTQSRVTGSCAAGTSIRVVNQDGTVTCETDDDTLGWGLTGNAGTTAMNFVGTTDAQPLNLRAANRQALRLQYAISPQQDSWEGINVQTGPYSFIQPGATAVTIAGGGHWGGQTFCGNEVYDDFGTIAGGTCNRAGDGIAPTSDAQGATVGGGEQNHAVGAWSTVAGGNVNVAGGPGSGGSASTVSGGQSNTASGGWATVPGGFLNVAGGTFSFAAGNRAKVRTPAQSGTGNGDLGTFVWADGTGADFTSTGSNQFLVRATNGVGINTNAPQGDLQIGSAIDTTAFRFGGAAARHHLISNRDMVFNGFDLDGAPNGQSLFIWRKNFSRFNENSFATLMTLGDDASLLVVGNLTGLSNASFAGTLSKGAGSFKIDHPLDPKNKYLYHSFVESPDMMNVYNGNVTTDADGYATVSLPEWFETLNRDFRYQLTVIDDGEAWVFAKVVREVKDNAFALRTSRPHTKVSWQVTGIRQDAYANANRIPVEQDKPEDERGTYLHADAFER